MQRCPAVEHALAELLAHLRAGDIAGAAELIDAGEATLLLGNGAADRYVGGPAVLAHFRELVDTFGGLPLEPTAPQAWSEGAVAWFADSVSAVFPAQVIPLRLTGVAVETDGVWKIVQLHMSAAVSDEELLGG
jgi:hypothetical protein